MCKLKKLKKLYKKLKKDRLHIGSGQSLIIL